MHIHNWLDFQDTRVPLLESTDHFTFGPWMPVVSGFEFDCFFFFVFYLCHTYMYNVDNEKAGANWVDIFGI